MSAPPAAIQRPPAFRTNWPARVAWLALIAYCFYAASILDVTWERFVVGIDNGIRFLGRMMPPETEASKMALLAKGLWESVEIAIISSALGITWFLPEEDRYTTSRGKFLDEICGLLGGRAAEALIFGDITTGASNDIERASHIARNMAMRYGMGLGLGTVSYGERQGSTAMGVDPSSTRNYSEETARKIDDFVRDVIAEQYKRAEAFLKEHHEKLKVLALVLLKKETMSIEEFTDIFEGRTEPVIVEEPEEVISDDDTTDDSGTQPSAESVESRS